MAISFPSMEIIHSETTVVSNLMRRLFWCVTCLGANLIRKQFSVILGDLWMFFKQFSNHSWAILELDMLWYANDQDNVWKWYSDTKMHPRIISEWFVSHQELHKNHFRVFCKSPRIAENNCHFSSESKHFEQLISNVGNYTFDTKAPFFILWHPLVNV